MTAQQLAALIKPLGKRKVCTQDSKVIKGINVINDKVMLIV